MDQRGYEKERTCDAQRSPSEVVRIIEKSFRSLLVSIWLSALKLRQHSVDDDAQKRWDLTKAKCWHKSFFVHFVIIQ